MYIDTETTGLDKDVDDIIQLSGIINVNSKIEEFDFCIRPREGYVLKEGAYLAHKKTTQEIDRYPSSQQVFKQFKEILTKHVNPYDKTDKFMFVAYNAMFDFNFVQKWFEYNDEMYFSAWFHFPPLDVMQMAAFHLIGERHLMPNFRLSTVYEQITGKAMQGAHDAMADIRATQEILSHILKSQRKF